MPLTLLCPKHVCIPDFSNFFPTVFKLSSWEVEGKKREQLLLEKPLPFNLFYILASHTRFLIGGSGGLVAKLRLTLLQPHVLPGSSVHGISQARMLEWVAIPISGILQDSINVTVCTSNIDLSPSLSLSWDRICCFICQIEG